MTGPQPAAVSMDRVRDLVSGLREARPAIFFTDMLLSSTLGWVAFALALSPVPWELRLLAFAAAVLLLYRALAFIHELFHQQAMKGFRIAWHACVGVPLMLPFLLYLPIHQGHHNSKSYGTLHDGEYDQFRGRCLAASAKLFGLNLAIPLALWVRFSVLTPLSFVLTPIREKMIPEFIHMALRMPFRAPEVKENMRAECLKVEVCCALFGWGLVAASWAWSWGLLLAWAVLAILVATLNTVRALGSTHLYVEEAEGRGARGQLMDSLNVGAGGLVTTLLCPVGLRYHALHHIAPYLPYHAMGRAHRLLIAQLPAGSEYHQATVRTLGEGWQRLRQATAA